MTSDPYSPAWRRPPAEEEQLRADGLGAVGMFLLAILSFVLAGAAGVYGDDVAPGWLSVLLLAVATVSLAWRRRHPSMVAVVVAAAFIGAGELHVPEAIILNVALFCAVYTVGAWEPDRRRAAWVRSAIFLAMGVWLLLSFLWATTDGSAELTESLGGSGIGALTPVAAYLLQQVVINVLYFAGAFWFGNHAWAGARQRARTEQRTAQLAAEQARVAQQAVTIERLRIARELHDAVAHHVSLMGVQAAAARAVLSRDPVAATAQLTAVEDSARSAVAELYDLLGTLRDDDAPAPSATLAAATSAAAPAAAAQAPPAAPAATLGLAELPTLVAEARRAGLDVDVAVVGEPAVLPQLVELNLYRIAQESLTNVVKHAGAGTRTTLRVRHLDGAVELEVSDDGRGRPGPPASGGGLGIVGMRERVVAMRGSLIARERPGGGFVVRASAPVPAPGARPGPTTPDGAA